MTINICDRCGAPLPPLARGEEPQDGRKKVNGAELCGDCAAEFEEFMQGAPVRKSLEAQPKTAYISVDINKFAKEVAKKALDEITYEGKTIREWAEILVKQQPTGEQAESEDDVITWAVPDPYKPDEEGGED